jgi:hypothetical protein
LVDLEVLLAEAKARVDSGLTCGAAFWRAIEAVKSDPGLVEAYADRLGELDRAGFENGVMIRLPIGPGTAIALAGLLLGLAGFGVAFVAPAPWDGLALLAGFAITLVTTHGLAHQVAGSVMGMRFTHWFAASWRRPTPGVKVDYASYLRTPARRRAWMHASGAIVTKLIPFLALIPALLIPVQAWVSWLLLGVGVVQMFTDLLFSTRASDWMKFKREMGFART